MIAEHVEGAAKSEREPRTNLFVLATLSVGGVSMPVKVRNVAEFGALVEAESLPPAGTQVRLRRAKLDVPASIAWSESGRAGLAFLKPVPVSDWLPAKPANSRQPYLDVVVQQIRESQIEPTVDTVDLPASGVSTDDLRRLLTEIQSLAEDLAADPAIVKRHAIKLQTLDLASQLVGKLIAPPEPGAR